MQSLLVGIPDIWEYIKLLQKLSWLNLAEIKIAVLSNKCILFLPCKHVSCCEKCAENLNNCPLCRNSIQSKIKIYL